MGFGFSSMPSAQQRAAQAMAQLPNSMTLAESARMAAGAPVSPQAPAQAPGPTDINLRAPQSFTPKPYNPADIQMPPASNGIPTPTPWTPGGVNYPGAYGDAAASAGSSAGTAASSGDIGSILASLFGF